MLKRIANLLEDNSRILALILTTVITYLSIITLKIPKLTFGYFDKVSHITAYTALSFCWFLSYKNKENKFFIIALLILVYGIVIEVIQEKLTLNREGDVFDILANTIGIVSGYIIVIFWIRNRKQ